LDESKIRLLHVEDSPDDHLILKRGLEARLAIAYDLVNVNTGEKGLTEAEKGNFDIILLDYRLPDMTGIEFVRQMKRKHIQSQIILLTGKGSENIAVEAMKLGVRDYILKEDINKKRLTDSIKDIILESSLPDTIDLEVAKTITVMFSQKSCVTVDSVNILLSNPKAEIPVEQLITTLSALSDIDIVEVAPFRSVVSCPDCKTLAATFYIECPECESTRMYKEEAIEHFDCGNIDFRPKYDKGEGRLVCPKCGKRLKVIGVDYRKIENWYRCSNNHFFGQPAFKFVCSQCDRKFSIEEAMLEMLYSYELTKTGGQTLRLGVKATELAAKTPDKKVVKVL
jgi:DNA-binding response OmpR family regulator